MRGRIKRFIEDKGYGFITGEDGQDYFFHISQVKDMVEIKNWMIVEFDVADGKRGKNAVNIRVTEQNNSPSKFITCGGTNIRLNNIKQYGLGKYPVLYEKIYHMEIIYNIRNSLREFLFEDAEIKKYHFENEWYCHGESEYRNGDERLIKVKDEVVRKRCSPRLDNWPIDIDTEDNYKTVMKPYLYITTYQKENFIFKETEVNFDVTEKYNEICNAMKYR